MKVFLALSLIAAGGVAYYLFSYRPAHSISDVMYALDASVEVVDSSAAVHLVVGRMRRGERVEVRGRTRNWVRVRRAAGQTGWVEAKNMLDPQTYETGRRLLRELAELPAQATGHVADRVNLRVEPSREAPPITELKGKQEVEIFGRRLMERPVRPSNPPPEPTDAGAAAAAAGREAWYLVRADAQAGWVLGRLVDLDVPAPIALYGQGTNLVAWLALNTVGDNGRRVPQYLVADRVGTQEFDFSHIRVLTWAKDGHRYATAYVESSLLGYFPIRVITAGGIPCFRLRLIESDGRKVQKIYGLFDTIARPFGTVEGWESNAMPARPAPAPNRNPRGRLAHAVKSILKRK